MLISNIIGCFVYSIILTLLINYICFKVNFLIYKPLEIHKDKFKSKIIISGGLIAFFYVYSIYLIFPHIINLEIFSILSIFIFIVGIMSDLKNFSAIVRLILISMISIIYLWQTNTYITDFKFEIINDIFDSNIFIAILFTTTCLIILINGYNFIDGVHGLTILHAILSIILFNYFIFFILEEQISFDSISILLPTLIVLYFQNIRKKIFLGDSGSYYLASIIGLMIINQTLNKDYSYPYVYASILIYPAFEVFFSIFRKIYFKKNPLSPDREHLHHLLKNYLEKEKKISFDKASILTGLIINIFVFLFGLICIHFYNHKYILINNIFLFCFIYLMFYFWIYRKLKV